MSLPVDAHQESPSVPFCHPCLVPAAHCQPGRKQRWAKLRPSPAPSPGHNRLKHSLVADGDLITVKCIKVHFQRETYQQPVKEVNKLGYSGGGPKHVAVSLLSVMKDFLNEMPPCIFRRKISEKQTSNGCLLPRPTFSLLVT